jgi:hypothetical protein
LTLPMPKGSSAAPSRPAAPARTEPTLATGVVAKASPVRKFLLGYRLPIIIGLSLLLIWEVVTRSLVAYLAFDYPEVAHWLRPTPTALLNLADDKLNANADKKVLEPVLPYPADETQERSYAKGMQTIEKQPLDPQPEGDKSNAPDDDLSPADYKQVQSWAEQALHQDPLNGRALRILGQVAEHSSSYERTEALMRGAARRSLQESLAVFWMMRDSYRNKNYPEAMRYADILLRTRPQLSRYVYPMLGRMAEIGTASVELKRVLADSPPWRTEFFTALPDNVSDARTPLELLLSLRDTATPPTDAERRAYLAALVQHKLYELAYYSWLQFLPQDQLSKTGRLFNGNFALPPSGLPFDWVYSKGAGVNLKFGQKSDREGKPALLIEFGPGRVDFSSGLKQLVLLPPGNYKFEGKYKPDLVSERGLLWSITCADATDPAGVSTTMNGAGAAWKDIDVAFTIPHEGCPAQYVSLKLDARSASEQFVSGAVWYSDLSISRVEDASPVASEQAAP